MSLHLSPHAAKRWQERCSKYSAADELARAKKLSPKRLAKLEGKLQRRLRPRKGREMRVTEDGIVLICYKSVVVTVYRIWIARGRK